MRRKRHTLLGAIVALLVLGFAAVAPAVQLQSGSTVLEFDGRISPKTLTKAATQPAALTFSGRVFTTDGSLPSALTKILVKVDRDLVVDTAGLPACRIGQIQSQDSKGAAKICRRSRLGRGMMAFTVAFPGAAPLPLRGRLLIFNGGTRRGVTMLLAHQFMTAPTPTVAVTRILIRRAGRKGLVVTMPLPRIAGGAGFLTSFSLKFRKKYRFKGESRSVISASCGHRRIRFKVRAFFANGGSSRGSVTHGCKAR
jgi:hypothetical protein